MPKAIETTGPRVLVIGARGALGGLVTDEFERAGWRVHPAGRQRLDHSRFRYIDVTDPATIPAAVGAMDLVISMVSDHQLLVERYVLAHGGLLVSLSTGPSGHLTALRADPCERRGAVVMHAGVAPGVTNLVAATLLAMHPGADEVELVFTVSTKGPGGPASGDFVYRGLTGRSRQATRWVELPEPFGKRKALGFAQCDRGWLGPVAGNRTVSTWLCLAERPAATAMAAVNRVGLMSRLPRRLFGAGQSGPPVEATREQVAHKVSVREGGRRLESRVIRGQGDFRMAAAAARVSAERILAQGDSISPGAWSIEQVLSLDAVDQALAEAGINVTGWPHDGLTTSSQAPRATPNEATHDDYHRAKGTR